MKDSPAAIRRLTPTEHQAFVAARTLALEWQPYLASALFALRPLAAPGFAVRPTMAVDARWRIYIDPAVFDSWGPEGCGAGLLHEANHLVRDHAGRAKAHAAADPFRWNLAGDAEANDDLLAAAVPLPEGVVTPAYLGQPEGLTAEDYYDAIASPATSPRQPGTSTSANGEGSCGSGSGGHPSPYELGDDGPDDGIGDAEADLIRRKVATEIAQIARKTRGTIPAGLQRWAEDQLRPPEVDWRRLLAGAVRSGLRTRAGQVDYSYARPARRQIPGVVLPAMRQPVPSVAVVIDTSGSMSQNDLQAALSEVQGICARVGVRGDQLRVVPVDAAATTPQRVRRAQEVHLVGGGGTDMTVGIITAEALRPSPDVIVVLTDGYTPWPERRGRAPLIIGLIGSTEAITTARASCPPPEWAKVVEIKD